MFTRVTGRSRAEARRAAQVLNDNPARVANEELRILISTVEDLLACLRTATDPELKQLREQTEEALDSAKTAITESGAQWLDQAGDLAERGGAYMRERPWTAMGVAALCVLAVGMWTGRALSE
jgi:ElaB/YqjD/DUF883 family membrane-anchored ribosome-binding protein